MVYAVDWENCRRKERERCIAIINDRVKGAEATCADHKGDAEIVRLELAAYARGLRDAVFAIRNGK